MKSAGVIGWPIAHSKSPLIHRFWMANLGIDGDYGRFAVDPDRLEAATRALAALGLAGVNVTVPHKQSIMAFLDRVSPSAARIGAVNCVAVGADGLTGSNTDVDGVRAAIGGFQSGTVALLGSGGAARSALWELARGSRRAVRIVARDRAKASALLTEFELSGAVFGFDAAAGAFAGASLVINATSLGMRGQAPLPVSVLDALDAVSPGAAVFDMVYAPLETELLVRARGNGLGTVDGLTMLIGQAAAAFELFYGAPAPRQHDSELRAVLTA